MRSLLPVGLVAAALVGAGCGADASPSSPSAASADPPADLPANVVVFAPDDLDDDEAAFSGEATWVPTAVDVRRTEAALRARVARTPGIETPYRQYVRQYTGLDDDVVLVNALCDSDSFDWRDEWVTVLDGGTCFWQAAVRDGVVVSFSVNGVA